MASSQQARNTSKKLKLSSQFDYELVKKLYHQKIKSCFGGEQNRRFPKTLYLNAIKKLQKVEKLIAAGESCPTEYMDFFRKYELFTEKGQVCLIKRTQNPNDCIQRYVSDDDSFVVLCKIHLSFGHGVRGQQEMREFVNKNYEINNNLIDLLFDCCNVCQCRDTNKTQGKIKDTTIEDNVVWLDIISLKECPDGLFEYLLLYVNKNTSFTLLRPLMMKCPIEISMEILKIFLDFGPPTKFEVFPKDLDLFRGTFDHLKTLCDTATIPITDELKPGINSDISVRVLREIQKWINDTGSNNWGIGCHILQWKLNNHIDDGNESNSNNQYKRTPYDSVFGAAPQAISSYPIQYNTISHDVDELEKIDKDNVIIIENDDQQCVNISGDSDENFDEENFDDENCDDEFVEEKYPIDIEINEIKIPIDHIEIETHNIESSSNQVTDPITTQVHVSKTESLKTSDVNDEPKICHVCQCKIFKIYHCSQCNNPVHVFCSTRHESRSNGKPTFMCTTCCIQKDSET